VNYTKDLIVTVDLAFSPGDIIVVKNEEGNEQEITIKAVRIHTEPLTKDGSKTIYTDSFLNRHDEKYLVNNYIKHIFFYGKSQA
jgi:hypothetical protein